MKRTIFNLSGLFLALLLVGQAPASAQRAPINPPVELAPGMAQPAQANSPGERAEPISQSVAGVQTSLFPAADSQNVEFVGHIGGITAAAAVQGNYAYVGEGPRLAILDISNPAAPVVLGKTAPLPGIVWGVAVSGGYAYIADLKAGLRVVDVSNPAAPVEVGFYDTPGSAWGVAVSVGYAYVADYGAGLRVVDVSNPAAPVEVGFYDTPGSARGVAVSGGYAYVADGGAGLRVVDVSNPTAPVEVGFYDTPGDARGIAVSGGYAYVADWYAGLRVVDMSNPTAPVEVGFYDTPGAAWGVAVSGGYAYIADGDAGLRVVDVSNPAAPLEVGFYDTPGVAYGVAVSGGYAYVADGDAGLRVVDVSNPAAPVEVGFYDTLRSACSVVVLGSYAYVADGYSGLRVVDVSNPAAPVEIGFYDTPGDASSVAVSGGYAYVAAFDAGLRVVDVSNPTAPVEVGFYDTPGGAWGVAVSGGYAYVADGYSGLRVVDVSNPAVPVEIGFYDTPGNAMSVVVSGGYAYVADHTAGLRVVDVSNPAAPVEVGFYATPGWAWGIAVLGDYAYVADYDAGLRVVDVSNPAAPVEVGFYATPGYAWGVAVSGGYAYVADGGAGLRVVDVSNPTAPVEVGFYDALWGAGDVAVSGGYAYVADGDGGLVILRFTGEGSFSSISGRVTDADGYPVGEVEITSDNGATTVTGIDGNYQLTGIPDGAVQLYPSKAGYTFFPGSLSINLVSDKTGQDFLAIPATCGDAVQQDGSELDGMMCLAPVAEPFLYLPVFSLSGPETVLQDTDYAGGRITSWFDHNKPTYGANRAVELYDGIERAGEPTYTLPNGLGCYDYRCYDGHDGQDFSQWDWQGGRYISEKAILPAASGTVLEVCHRDTANYPNESCSRSTSLGRYIVISHLDNTYATLYAHLASIADWVIPGAVVTRNEYSSPAPIGVMGGSGGSPLNDNYWAVHLHFQVFFNGFYDLPWAPTSAQVVDTFGWLPVDDRPDDWDMPSVPLWKDFSPISCIPGSESANITVGGVTAQIPAGAVAEGQVVTLSPTSFSDDRESALRGLGRSFNLHTFDSPLQHELLPNNSDIFPEVFTQPITISVNYSGTRLSHLVADQSAIYWFNDVSSEWVIETTILDTANSIATALVTHEGYFDLQAPLVCPNDITEPEDDSPSLKAILLTRLSDISMPRWFDIQEDEDWFSLEGIAGITYTIQTQNLADGVDTILTAYQSDGETIIATDDNSGGGMASLLSFRATEDDIYYIRVSQATGSVFGCDSSYQVRMSNNLQLAFLPVVMSQSSSR